MSDQEIIELVEQISPSIVSIYTVKLARQSFLRPVPVKGAGSGFIVDEQYILTNYHVLKGMQKAKMVLPHEEREIEGQAVGGDPENDLAVIKTTASDLTPLTFGDSSQLQVGQSVLAIGNALGLKGSPTVSHGIISAPSRTIRSKKKIFENLIQTDAAINPGNSGGPLINMEGEVIGVNTAMIPWAQGMGFAIRSSIAKRVSDQIIEHGEVVRPWLGVYLADVTPSVARRVGTQVKRGALVVKTSMQSPASRAGLRRGDILRKIDEIDVRNSSDVKDVIASKDVGDQISITFIRQGSKNQTTATLVKSPK